MKDLYKILNVNKNSSQNDIKKAYKKLAFQYHPDKNSSDDAMEKFKEISEAYEILTNNDKKRIYDNFGYDSVKGDLPFINPLDLFQSLFNVDFTGLGENMNSNIFVFSDLSSNPFNSLQNYMKHTIDCTIEELYKGTQKEFNISHNTKKGIKNTKYIINVKKGSKNKDNIIVKEGGNYIPELNIIEDLIIEINELDNPRYKRKDNDLYITENITLCEALTGVEIYIDHLDGPLQIKINDIVKPNQLFRVNNKGMPIKYDDKSITENNNKDNNYGDLIIDLFIEFPESLNDKQMNYLKKILIHLERKKHNGTLVHGEYYKDKEEIYKEFIDESNDDIGCIQQ